MTSVRFSPRLFTPPTHTPFPSYLPLIPLSFPFGEEKRKGNRICPVECRSSSCSLLGCQSGSSWCAPLGPQKNKATTTPTGLLSRDLKILSCTLSPSTLVPCVGRRKRCRPTKELRPQTGASGNPPLLTLIAFIHLVLQVEVREVGQGGGSERSSSLCSLPSGPPPATELPLCSHLCSAGWSQGAPLIPEPSLQVPYRSASGVPSWCPRWQVGEEQRCGLQKLAACGVCRSAPAVTGSCTCQPVAGEQQQVAPGGLASPSCGDKSDVMLTYPFSHLKKKRDLLPALLEESTLQEGRFAFPLVGCPLEELLLYESPPFPAAQQPGHSHLSLSGTGDTRGVISTAVDTAEFAVPEMPGNVVQR